MSRGIERGRIVRDDADRRKRLDWLRRTVETYGWRLHGFALMANHEHLFVQTPEANLSAGMQHLNGSYTGYFNRRHRRSGHLLEGRFKGHLIEEEGYFLAVSRYIHLNPVRAKIVASPEEYPWSSCPGYQRASRTLDWVTYDQVLGEFGRTTPQARRSYMQFVRAGIEEPPKSPLGDAASGLLLGSAKFIERIGRLLVDRPADSALPQLEKIRQRPSLDAIIATVSEHFGLDASQWKPGRRNDDASRAVAACLARRRFHYSAREVADALGYRSHGSVRNAITRIENADQRLKKIVESLHQELH